MNILLFIVSIIAIAAVAGYLVTAANRRVEELKGEKALAERRLTTAIGEKSALQDAASQLQTDLSVTEKQLQMVMAQAERDEKKRQEQFDTELKLAREQLRSQMEKEMETRTEALKRTNSEQMETIVSPLKKELEQLRSLVTTSKDEQSRQTTALEAQIKAVFEHDKERDKTTQSLAEALKNRGKVQGDWGEQVLENILRDSGLREGEEYEKQFNIKGESGNNERPDVIVKGADGSRIIIDSKVSLTAYTDYVGAETDDERKIATKNNYDSIWKHVTELSDKKYYQDVDKAMPIVLMFIPNEGSYILAMNKDPQLGVKAYRKGVLIINPTNLMVVLKLMFLTWQNTRQEKNNRAILDAAAKIYEKYCTFAEGYLTLGQQITTAQKTYSKGLMQLKDGKGNLSKQLQGLLDYGVTPTKHISDKLTSTSEE